MHPEDIKAGLRKAGWTQTELADELSVSGSSISQVIHGQARSSKIEQAIAALIGRKRSEIWEPKRRPSRIPLPDRLAALTGATA